MIKEDLLKTPFVISRFPSLPCPKCAASLLPKDKDRFFGITSGSNFMMDMEGNDPEYYQAVSSLLLQCANLNCGESVVCTGMVSNVEDHESWNGRPHYEKQIDPHFFLPPLQIISIPENLPKPILKSLLDSLTLFWVNPSSSGNALRVLVEALMDHERIVKSYRDKHKVRKMYTLHRRIELYKAKNSDLASKLLAIKWIGNNGSHIAGLTRDHLMKAYQILEYVLGEIFEKKSKTLAKLVSHINRKKGRI